MVEVITSDKEVTFFAIVCSSASMLTQKFSTSLTEIFLEVRCVTSKILFSILVRVRITMQIRDFFL